MLCFTFFQPSVAVLVFDGFQVKEEICKCLWEHTGKKKADVALIVLKILSIAKDYWSFQNFLGNHDRREALQAKNECASHWVLEMVSSIYPCLQLFIWLYVIRLRHAFIDIGINDPTLGILTPTGNFLCHRDHKTDPNLEKLNPQIALGQFFTFKRNVFAFVSHQ